MKSLLSAAKMNGIIECHHKSTKDTNEKYFTFPFKGAYQFFKLMYSAHKNKYSRTIIHWN